jgi:hypothetical protein
MHLQDKSGGEVGFEYNQGDSFFADKNVDKMANNEKRCMIYWWYATNIYSTCGKRKRRQLPNCLVKAIRHNIDLFVWSVRKTVSLSPVVLILVSTPFCALPAF